MTRFIWTDQHTTNTSNNTPSCQEIFQETGNFPRPWYCHHLFFRLMCDQFPITSIANGMRYGKHNFINVPKNTTPFHCKFLLQNIGASVVLRSSVGPSTSTSTSLVQSRLVLVNFNSLIFSAGSWCASAICCLPFDIVGITRYGFGWLKMGNYPACYIYSFADIINSSSQLAYKPVYPRSIGRCLSAGSPSRKNTHYNTPCVVSIRTHKFLLIIWRFYLWAGLDPLPNISTVVVPIT